MRMLTMSEPTLIMTVIMLTMVLTAMTMLSKIRRAHV